eukprot:Skav229989  [mRNA]  locus=scaffold1837:117257:117862:+ [translate_table: standard]
MATSANVPTHVPAHVPEPDPERDPEPDPAHVLEPDPVPEPDPAQDLERDPAHDLQRNPAHVNTNVPPAHVPELDLVRPRVPARVPVHVPEPVPAHDRERDPAHSANSSPRSVRRMTTFGHYAAYTIFVMWCGLVRRFRAPGAEPALTIPPGGDQKFLVFELRTSLGVDFNQSLERAKQAANLYFWLTSIMQGPPSSFEFWR